MKKVYQQPAMQVVKINMSRHILIGSEVTGITTNNIGLSLGGAGGGITPRAPELSDENTIWGDEEW